MRLKYISILLTILFLLSFSIGLGHTFDFEETSTIDTSKNLDARIKGWYDVNSQEFQVLYTATDKVIYAKLFDSSWTEIDSDSFDCDGSGCFSDASDYNYINAESGTYWYILTDENSGTHDGYILNYSFEDSAFATIDTENRANQLYAIRVPGVSNRYLEVDTGKPLLIWDHLDGLGVRDEDLRYTNTDNLGGSTFSGNGKFDLPSTYHTPDDVQVVWCNDAYHVIVEKDGGLFDITYDDDIPYGTSDWKNIYSLSPGLVVGSVDGWGVESIDDFLYVTVSGNLTLDKGISLQQWECNDDHTITPVYNEVIYQNYVHHLNEFSTQSISDNVLWYQFKEADGLLDDSSPSSYSGTVTGGNYRQNSLFDYSMEFGSGSYVEVGNVLNFVQTDVFTFSAWVKTTSTGHNHVFQKHNHTHYGGYEFGVDSGYPYIQAQESNGDTDQSRSNITVNDGEWHFIVGVFSGDDNPANYKFYVDGELTGTVVVLNQGLGNLDNDESLFVSHFSNSFIGNLDETAIWDKELNSTEVSLLYNQFDQNPIYKPYLTRNDWGTYYLFYEGDSDLFVSYEDPCQCNPWSNTTICVDEKIKQTRSCHPTLCGSEIEERYVDSVYCAKELNRSLGIYNQGFEKWFSQTSCDTDWVNVGEGIAECSPNPITINPSCVNISSNIETVPIFDFYSLGGNDGCPQGEFHITTCNPNYECFDQDYNCDQLNISQTDYYDDYTIGDIVTTKSSMFVDSVCKCEWLIFDYGIKRFRIRSTSTITCDIACEEEWECVNEDYRGLKHIDCSLTNITFCQYGCSDGNCMTSIESDRPGTVSNAFDTFLNPNATMKIVYSLLGSAFLGFIGLGAGHWFDKSNKHGGLLFTILFGMGFSFFALITWIPALIIIIIVAFTLAYVGLKALK
jgi:hypothetical protein